MSSLSLVTDTQLSLTAMLVVHAMLQDPRLCLNNDAAAVPRAAHHPASSSDALPIRTPPCALHRRLAGRQLAASQAPFERCR